MTDLFTAKRSYVREFNAASLAEALILADRALRMDGVTVAVWRNRVESLNPEDRKYRQNLINRFIDAGKRKILPGHVTTEKDEKARLLFKPHILSDFLAVERYDRVYDDKFEPVLKSIGIPLEDYLPYLPQEIDCLKELFESFEGYLEYQHNMDNIFTHRDGKKCPKSYGMQDVLFYGGHVRILETLKGEITIYFKNEAECEPYSPPEESMAFHLPSYTEKKSAYHTAPPALGLCRGILYTDVCVYK